MHKKARVTPLAKLMAAYDDGRGITDNQLAKKLKAQEDALGNVAPTQPTISRIAAGKTKNPDEVSLEPFARFFGCSVAYLRGKEPRGESLPPVQHSDLSPQAIEVARAWMKLPDYKRNGYAQGIMVDAAVLQVFPELERAMKLAATATNPHYHKLTENFSLAKEKLMKQAELDFKGGK